MKTFFLSIIIAFGLMLSFMPQQKFIDGKVYDIVKSKSGDVQLVSLNGENRINLNKNGEVINSIIKDNQHQSGTRTEFTKTEIFVTGSILILLMMLSVWFINAATFIKTFNSR